MEELDADELLKDADDKSHDDIWKVIEEWRKSDKCLEPTPLLQQQQNEEPYKVDLSMFTRPKSQCPMTKSEIFERLKAMRIAYLEGTSPPTTFNNFPIKSCDFSDSSSPQSTQSLKIEDHDIFAFNFSDKATFDGNTQSKEIRDCKTLESQTISCEDVLIKNSQNSRIDDIKLMLSKIASTNNTLTNQTDIINNNNQTTQIVNKDDTINNAEAGNNTNENMFCRTMLVGNDNFNVNNFNLENSLHNEELVEQNSDFNVDNALQSSNEKFIKPTTLNETMCVVATHVQPPATETKTNAFSDTLLPLKGVNIKDNTQNSNATYMKFKSVAGNEMQNVRHLSKANAKLLSGCKAESETEIQKKSLRFSRSPFVDRSEQKVKEPCKTDLRKVNSKLSAYEKQKKNLALYIEPYETDSINEVQNASSNVLKSAKSRLGPQVRLPVPCNNGLQKFIVVNVASTGDLNNTTATSVTTEQPCYLNNFSTNDFITGVGVSQQSQNAFSNKISNPSKAFQCLSKSIGNRSIIGGINTSQTSFEMKQKSNTYGLSKTQVKSKGTKSVANTNKSVAQASSLRSQKNVELEIDNLKFVYGTLVPDDAEAKSFTLMRSLSDQNSLNKQALLLESELVNHTRRYLPTDNKSFASPQFIAQNSDLHIKTIKENFQNVEAALPSLPTKLTTNSKGIPKPSLLRPPTSFKHIGPKGCST